MERIICLIIGYAFGLIQTSYIIGRIKGIDIRTKGSGNAGTTNAIRTMGWKLGVITAIMDILKCIVAVVIVRYIFRDTSYVTMLGIYAAAGAILGHDFPVYLKFKGGKGIAASAGMIIAFGDWKLILAGIICFFIPVLISHYVSLGSLVLSASFFVGMIICGQLGCYAMDQNYLIEMYIVTGILTAIAYWQHRGNIKRLAAGKENKIS